MNIFKRFDDLLKQSINQEQRENKIIHFKYLCDIFPSQPRETLKELIQNNSHDYLRNIEKFGCAGRSFEECKIACDTLNQSQIDSILIFL